MPTIHDQIDDYLAADLHNQLSTEEREKLHRHLTECPDCRKLHQEMKIMDTTLQTIFAPEKADSTFEQRMLARFRTSVPNQPGRIRRFIVDLMRLRATQVTAAAVLVILLIGVGGLLTVRERRSFSYLGKPDDELMLAAVTDENPGMLPRQRNASEMLAPQSYAHKSAASASPVPAEEVGANPVDTYRRDDVTTLGVRSSPDMVQKLPAATGSTIHNEETAETPEAERLVVAGSNIPTAEEIGPNPAGAPSPVLANRKLIRNATVEVEVANFDEAVQKITAFANEDRGYVATTSSQKQENGKLKGEIVVKVVPENLDRFLQKIRGLGELKNQTLGTEDVTKNYFDTDSRLRNARIMEQRLVDMLKTKTGKVADLLAVEKELGRVREEIEKMQGDLKYWDAQVQFSTVTISLTEKDMEAAAAFLLKEHATLSLYTPNVEKTYNEIKALASPKIQIAKADMNRENSGQVSAQINLLISPEESDGVIARIKKMARVENFKVETERVAQGGSETSENAKTKRERVEVTVTLSREETEHGYQQTNLRLRTSAVDEKSKQLRALTEKQEGRVLHMQVSQDADGREFAYANLRVPMKNYPTFMQALRTLGKVQDISVARTERSGLEFDEANAPADLQIQVVGGGYIVDDGGIVTTLRQTIRQGAETLLWSLRMVGVAIAFFAPWVIALVGGIWIARRIRARRKL
jgi:hypothetical protein